MALYVDCNNSEALTWEVLVKLLSGISSGGCAAMRTLDSTSAPAETFIELRDDGGIELRDDGGIELRD